MAAHHLIEDRFDDEDFFFRTAEQVIVERTAENDRLRGTVEIGRFVDHDRRITGAGDNRSLGLLHRRFYDAGTSRHGQDIDARMRKQCVGRFDRRFGKTADQVIDTDLRIDRFVITTNAFGPRSSFRPGGG